MVGVLVASLLLVVPTLDDLGDQFAQVDVGTDQSGGWFWRSLLSHLLGNRRTILLIQI
jgi:hypothetical protein